MVGPSRRGDEAHRPSAAAVRQPQHLVLVAQLALRELPLCQGLHGLGGAHGMQLLIVPSGRMTINCADASEKHRESA